MNTHYSDEVSETDVDGTNEDAENDFGLQEFTGISSITQMSLESYPICKPGE